MPRGCPGGGGWAQVELTDALPPREVVHRNINQLPSIRKLQVSICDWERLTVFSQQLPQEPWIPENSTRPLTEFLQF